MVDIVFVLFKQKTAYEMRISDWSSDVCSSDLNAYLQARTVFNGSIGFKGPDDAYSIRLIGRNLTDKRYRVSQLIVGGLWTFSNYAPPRSWAIEGSFKF